MRLERAWQPDAQPLGAALRRAATASGRGVDPRVAAHQGVSICVVASSPVAQRPAMAPVRSVARVAAIRVLSPRRARSSRRDGTSAAVPPTNTATEGMCAKPHSA